MNLIHLQDEVKEIPEKEYDVLITDFKKDGVGEAIGIKGNQVDYYTLEHCVPFDGSSIIASYTLAEYTTNAMVTVGDRIYRESLKYILK